jgi:hypothetical protein
MRWRCARGDKLVIMVWVESDQPLDEMIGFRRYRTGQLADLLVIGFD